MAFSPAAVVCQKQQPRSAHYLLQGTHCDMVYILQRADNRFVLDARYQNFELKQAMCWACTALTDPNNVMELMYGVAVR